MVFQTNHRWAVPSRQHVHPEVLLANDTAGAGDMNNVETITCLIPLTTALQQQHTAQYTEKPLNVLNAFLVEQRVCQRPAGTCLILPTHKHNSLWQKLNCFIGIKIQATISCASVSQPFSPFGPLPRLSHILINQNTKYNSYRQKVTFFIMCSIPMWEWNKSYEKKLGTHTHIA
jgi:hypothetical protein